MRSSISHAWGTLAWIDAMLQLARTDYALGSFDEVVYRKKIIAYNKHILIIERDFVLTPNCYKYLLQVKDLIKHMKYEVRYG